MVGKTWPQYEEGISSRCIILCSFLEVLCIQIMLGVVLPKAPCSILPSRVISIKQKKHLATSPARHILSLLYKTQTHTNHSPHFHQLISDRQSPFSIFYYLFFIPCVPLAQPGFTLLKCIFRITLQRRAVCLERQC